MNITIDARRWFHKSAGNTYHSVKVYVDNKLIGENLFKYGYGDCFIQTAYKILIEKGLFEETREQLPSGMGKDYYTFIRWVVDNPDKVHITCTDVTRRKDL